ncbi:MAG: nuclear transport factor 2 family protein [Acidobacteriia bacterium]|nr:nuclear transport factor 2 family protein [Terriglobia bacterium]
MKSRGYLSAALGGAVILLSVCTSSCSSASSASDEADIRALEKSYVDAFNAKDTKAMMAVYSPDESLVAFDAIPPRQYVGFNAYKKDNEDFVAAFPGPIKVEQIDWKIETDGTLGYGHGFLHAVLTDKDGKQLDSTVRMTDVYRKINGKWLIVHEHLSFPVDMATGKADLTSKP